MGKLFGTDGIRGIAGQTLTAELAFHVGQAVAAVLTEEKGSRPLITIGKDTRISSDMLEAALMAGICSVGGDVMPLGTIPTPAVAFLTVQQQADAGIVISASHNPYAYNGIKVFNAQGYKLSDEMEQRVEDLILNHAELPASVDGTVGRRHHGMHALHSAYVQHLLGSIDCDLTGLRVLVDCANGAASATAPDLFRALPLQADFIHTEPDGVNINNGCGSTHLESLARGVVSGGYDLGIAFDGDADRLLAVDENGDVVDGDKIIAICAKDMKERGELDGDAAVVTVMSNMGFHKFCADNDIHCEITKVGDRYVLERMLEKGYAIGGEQSGHVIFLHHSTTGDGEVTAAQVLQTMKRTGKSLSELAKCMEVYPQVLKNVRVSNIGKVRFSSDEEIKKAIANAEAELGEDGRVLVRVSGTEPLVRVMLEGKDEKLIEKLCDEIAEVVRERLI
mgnify:CR=1 FL=1